MMEDKVLYKYFTFEDGTLIREYSYDKMKIYRFLPDREYCVGDWIPMTSYMRFHPYYLNKKPLTLEEGESYMNKIRLVNKLKR